jgi:hypothetical protein
MPPKTPKQLREQIEKANEESGNPGHQRTAEGMEVPTPSERELIGNLEKLAQPLPRRDSSPDE